MWVWTRAGYRMERSAKETRSTYEVRSVDNNTKESKRHVLRKAITKGTSVAGTGVLSPDVSLSAS